MLDLWSWSFLSASSFSKYCQNRVDRTPGDFFSLVLEFLNIGKKNSRSRGNFSMAVLVGHTLQIRDTGLGITFGRITLSMLVRDMVQLWLQKTTSLIPLAAHVFKNCTGFLLRSLIYQDFSLRLGMFSQVDVPLKLRTWCCSLARGSFLWQMSLSC